MDRPSFTLGIEEEYLVVDRETRDLVAEPGEAFFQAASDALGAQVTPEFLQCQIEVGTKPHARVSDAVTDLRALRRGIASAAEAHGYAVIAASTHPFATWRKQTHTRKERYAGLWSDMGATAWRMLICGMHIHIGIEDEDLRIDLMNQAAYFLPHMLALSGSSPFWEGQDTRLASYRLTIFDAVPRALPYLCGLVERHPEGSQAFLPMTQAPFLVIVAPDEGGVPGTPRAFLTRPGQGINLLRGTWHGVLTPLEAPGLFAVVDRIGEGANLEEHRFGEAWEIVAA